MSPGPPDGEEGAIAATVTVMLLALLGIAMLAIDGGQLFTSRRNVLTDTDAAALAAAREMVGAGCTSVAKGAAESVAVSVLTANDANTTTPTPPSIDCLDRAGRASVTAIRPTDLIFGGLAGLPEVDVQATSVAQYGPLETGTGLRPLTLCNKDAHFLEFVWEGGHLTRAEIEAMLPPPDGVALWASVEAIRSDTSAHLLTGPEGPYPVSSDVHKVQFSRTSPDLGCGGAAGNWGWLAFESPSGLNDLRDWIQFGYPGPISVGASEDCAPEDDLVTDCMGQTGAGGNSWRGAFEAIRCPSNLTAPECAAAGRAFPIVVFNAVCIGGNGGGGNGGGGNGGGGNGGGGNAGGGNGGGGNGGGGNGGGGGAGSSSGGDPTCVGGNGNNARYDHVAFLGLILRDWEPITGNMVQPSWFGFEFMDEFLANGTITGTPPAIGPGLVGIQLCGGGYATTIDDYCVVP